MQPFYGKMQSLGREIGICVSSRNSLAACAATGIDLKLLVCMDLWISMCSLLTMAESPDCSPQTRRLCRKTQPSGRVVLLKVALTKPNHQLPPFRQMRSSCRHTISPAHTVIAHRLIIMSSCQSMILSRHTAITSHHQIASNHNIAMAYQLTAS